MKYRKDSRQFVALERLLVDIEKYKDTLQNGVVPAEAKKTFLVEITSNKEEARSMTDKEVINALTSKLKKAEQCLSNLKAKGVFKDVQTEEK